MKLGNAIEVRVSIGFSQWGGTGSLDPHPMKTLRYFL